MNGGPTPPADAPLSVVVVTFNSADAIGRSLPAITAELRAGDELIVCDNGSSDGTVARVRELAPDARVTEIAGNPGFGVACNTGAAAATNPLLLFLNPDAVAAAGFRDAIVLPLAEGRGWDAWQGLLTSAGGTEVNTWGGAVHFTGIAWAGGAGRPVAQAPAEPVEIPFASGGCLLIARDRWEELGGFSPPYFLYHEDTDLGLRLWLAGGRVGIEPRARVDHEYEFDKGSAKWRYLETNRWATVLRTYPGRAARGARPGVVRDRARAPRDRRALRVAAREATRRPRCRGRPAAPLARTAGDPARGRNDAARRPRPRSRARDDPDHPARHTARRRGPPARRRHLPTCLRRAAHSGPRLRLPGRRGRLGAPALAPARLLARSPRPTRPTLSRASLPAPRPPGRGYAPLMGELDGSYGDPAGPRLTRRRLAQLAAAAGAAAALPGGALRTAAAAAAPATRTYDDGSDAIPSAVPGAGNPGRVIVIGAGWAGLTAANALRNAGVETVVLEARRRPGGRAWTRRVAGHPVDLGCSWIHDPIGNPMADFARQAGIGTTLAAPEADIATIRFYDQVSGGALLPTEVIGAFVHELGFEDAEADYAQRLGPDASVRDAALAYLDEQKLHGDERRRAEFAIRLFSEQEENMYWNRISLPYLASYSAPYDGVGQGNFPTGGYRKLIEAMAGDTEVRFGHRVRTIHHDRDGVFVEATRRGTGKRIRLRGSHVLCTVSLGVLKHHGVEFAPRLPKAKRAVIRRLGFGYFEKVALAFDEPFWQEGAHTHIVRLAQPFGFPLTLDLQSFSGFPVLAALYAGRPAQQLQNASREHKTKLALAAIAEAIGGKIPDPVDTYATAWRRDPFAHGAYSTVIAGRPKSDLEALGSPVGRVLFAGEATNPVRNGYADGALTTGVREAKRLLQAKSVALSAG